MEGIFWMLRTFLEHILIFAEGVAIFCLLLYVMAVARDLWLAIWRFE